MDDDVEGLTVSEDLEIKKIVGQIAAAYFGNSHVTPGEIPAVISHIANSLATVGTPAPEAPAPAVEDKKLTPAQIRRSITADAIISFEDNKPYKTMRRHLASRGLSPDEYRSKWGLPRDYPMVAPSYSETRSNLAKARGLGARVRPKAPPAETATLGETPSASATAPAAESAGAAPLRQRKPAAGRRAPAKTARVASASSKGAAASNETGAKRGGTAPARSRRAKSPAEGSDTAE